MLNFTNVKVFADIIEDEALEQIKKLAKEYPTSKIRIMPDVHAGKGCTIGTTMTIKDAITPNLVGVTIDAWVARDKNELISLYEEKQSKKVSFYVGRFWALLREEDFPICHL